MAQSRCANGYAVLQVQPGLELRHLKEAPNEASDVAGLDSARGYEDIR